MALMRTRPESAPPIGSTVTVNGATFTFRQDRVGVGEYDFRDELWHVSGDLRASLKNVLHCELDAEWKVTTGSQGLIIRKDPKELLLR